MYSYKIFNKKISLWIFIIIQVLLIVSIYYIHKDERIKLSKEISFLDADYSINVKNQTYHIEGETILLKKQRVKDEFIDFNSSLCYVNGTDLTSMSKMKSPWTCNCKNGWHGLGCGQSEVVWRALLAHRQKLQIKGPRIFARKILYIFEVNYFIENLIDIRINELNEVIDLFVLIENEGNRIEKLLKNDYLKKYHKKIFYLNGIKLNKLWYTLTSSIQLENDDIILVSKAFEIPNKFTLSFLKYYDNWSEPVLFRLRWSIFGFFWKHPNKTRTEGLICTVRFMKNTFDSNFENLFKTKYISGLILGDLNHYGGWYCEYCMEPIKIIELANKKRDIKIIPWKELNNGKIDTSYIEDLIGNGLYLDGQTVLQRSRKYQDSYFSPNYVSQNSMQFDYLLINLYTKLDYYEG